MTPVDPTLAQAIVANALAYAIFTLDFEGTILSWSPGAEEVVGYTAQEAVGVSFSTIFVAADRVAGADRQELETAIAEGRAEDTRWHLRKDGERFWANGVTMRLAGQSVLLKVMRDETRAKLAEDQRVLLLNELNHRIKNTLATVQSIVDQSLRAAQVERTCARASPIGCSPCRTPTTSSSRKAGRRRTLGPSSKRSCFRTLSTASRSAALTCA